MSASRLATDSGGFVTIATGRTTILSDDRVCRSPGSRRFLGSGHGLGLTVGTHLPVPRALPRHYNGASTLTNNAIPPSIRSGWLTQGRDVQGSNEFRRARLGLNTNDPSNPRSLATTRDVAVVGQEVTLGRTFDGGSTRLRRTARGPSSASEHPRTMHAARQRHQSTSRQRRGSGSCVSGGLNRSTVDRRASGIATTEIREFGSDSDREQGAKALSGSGRDAASRFEPLSGLFTRFVTIPPADEPLRTPFLDHLRPTVTLGRHPGSGLTPWRAEDRWAVAWVPALHATRPCQRCGVRMLEDDAGDLWLARTGGSPAAIPPRDVPEFDTAHACKATISILRHIGPHRNVFGQHGFNAFLRPVRTNDHVLRSCSRPLQLAKKMNVDAEAAGSEGWLGPDYVSLSFAALDSGAGAKPLA